MAISDLTPRQDGPTSVVFSWSSDLEDPTFYVWVNGVFVGTTLETSYVVAVGVGEQVQFDVFDDAAGVPLDYYPPFLVLRWQGRDGSVLFRVEEDVSGQWVFRGLVPFSVGNVYRHRTGVLSDSTEYTHRVVPLDVEGRTGSVLEFSAEMVRYPDAPSQDAVFAGGELVIS